ncbi:dipeptide/oligopeptide/nickel ABC transporter ATP-binding protein [Paenibacillus sp.]|uniref:ABC transporter ATP-binding protein n=1 Tax=Paenibacillus sp. TaxID=58172 RepID=UPI002D7597D9|nr:dipeptide/oligopeptide/nickel ABC transporter ATP-binding protein [Paenibacillus sp.]HZG86889.1 dipeptide/oligopeptide/nickel ABC transporter ATP-binding protein [Paenibacillus sp.]
MEPLLRIERISKSYTPDARALSDISLTVGRGECVGIVGESGSGKSTLAKIILGLAAPDSGDVYLNERSMLHAKRRERKTLRKDVQVVFQDPNASLNSKLPVWRTVVEPLENYPDSVPAALIAAGRTKRDWAAALLRQVGLPEAMLDRYPRQLSGGQKQRVAIARAIGLHPKLLVCDEPTSGLDVSVQAQILNLLKELRMKHGLSCLLISHDLAAVRFLADRVAVLRGGVIVDRFPAERLLAPERHEYTRRLAEAAQ